MIQKGMKDSITDYYRTNPGKFVIIIFIVIFGIIGILTAVFPELFWDRFIWKYYWGSIEADAQDRTINGISEGYNMVSTLTYGIILAAAIFVIYRLIVVLGIELDKWFFLAVIPFILFGGFARALEDAMLFTEPAIYLFIAPNIYVFTGLIAVAFMVISQILSKALEKLGKKKELRRANYFLRTHDRIVKLYISIMFAMVLLLYLLFVYGTHYPFRDLVLVVIIAVIPCVLISWHAMFHPEKKTTMPMFFGGFGVVMLGFPAIMVGLWFTSPDTWLNHYLPHTTADAVSIRPEVLAAIIGLSLVATGIWTVVAHFVSTKTKWKKAAVFTSGVNLTIVFGQFTDAAATFIAIDYYNYWEKHVVPGFLIGVLDSAAVMFLLKVIALFFAIYVLDIALKEELKHHRQIVPLIKLAVLVLGLAPGTRDMLRLAMGV
jgi:uncharacterized membrane protein